MGKQSEAHNKDSAATLQLGQNNDFIYKVACANQQYRINKNTIGMAQKLLSHQMTKLMARDRLPYTLGEGIQGPLY
ncbi:hypothetical protein FKM82_025720 [Ascaphus truei]